MMNDTFIDSNGKPVNKAYLECVIPKDLQESINNYKSAKTRMRLYLLKDELSADINMALRCDEISLDCAEYLREKYLTYNGEDLPL